MFRWLLFDDIPFAPGMVVWFLLLTGGAWVGDTIGNAPPSPPGVVFVPGEGFAQPETQELSGLNRVVNLPGRSDRK